MFSSRRNTQTKIAPKACGGYTLFELLISVVVLSLGLMGVGGLQIISVRSNFEAFQRTEASQLANDIVDRIRANSTMISTYVSGDLGGGTITVEPAVCDGTEDAVICQQKIVAHDRWEWEQVVDNSTTLINTKVCLSQDTTNPGHVQVAIAWRGGAQRGGEITTATTSALNDCGKTDSDEDNYLKQVVVNTYVTTSNPY